MIGAQSFQANDDLRIVKASQVMSIFLAREKNIDMFDLKRMIFLFI